jgi:hypothetical protein
LFLSAQPGMPAPAR